MAHIIKALDRLEFNSAGHRVRDLDVYPVADFYDNMAQTPEGSRDKTYNGARYGQGSFKMDLRSSAAVATAPEIGPLLKAAGLSETTVALTSVTYAPSPTFAFTALTIDCYKGNAYKCSVANAIIKKIVITLEPNKPVDVAFEFTGTYVAPSDAAGSAALSTLTGAVNICKGLSCGAAGMSTKIKKMVITIENKTEDPDYDIAGTNGVMNPEIGDREITVEATFRLPTVAAVDTWTSLAADTELIFSAANGGSAGNAWAINLRGYLMESPKYEGDLFHEMTVKCRESMGNRLAMIFT